MDRSTCRRVQVLRWCPAPAGAGQPAHRGGQTRPLRPQIQQGVCRTRHPLWRLGGSGPGREAEGQAPGGAADALYPGLVLARAGVRLRRPHAGRGGRLVPQGRRPPAMPPAGRGLADFGLRGHRGRGAAAAAGDTVRAGPLVNCRGRSRHSHQGRPHPLLGALEADRPPRRCPFHRHHGAGLPRR